MLQLHRIYTPDELRAMARRPPAGSRHPVASRSDTDPPMGKNGRRTAVTALARILRRGGVRRPAPGTA